VISICQDEIDPAEYGWTKQTLGGLGGEGWTPPKPDGICWSRGAAQSKIVSDLMYNEYQRSLQGKS